MHADKVASIQGKDVLVALKVIVGQHFGALHDGLAAELRRLQTSPFQRVRVLVGASTTGRLLGQEMAKRLGICAGVEFVTLTQLMAQLAAPAEVARERSRWLSSALDWAVWEAAEELADEFPVLARAAYGSPDPQALQVPGRRHSLASRLASLLRWYLDHDPDLLATWLDNDLGEPDVNAAGEPLDEEAAWQPALLRHATAALQVSPIDVLEALLGAASVDDVPTLGYGLDELTVPQQRLLAALSATRDVTLFQPASAGHHGWAEALGAKPIALEEDVRPAPPVTVHGSHGPSRQVEVLRDELTRAFQQDPTLQPRQVAILCPNPERYASLLDAAFAPLPGNVHPGRTLRVQPTAALPPNPVFACVVALLRLGESRATATELTELLLLEPIAHRWHLDDRERLVEIVSAGGIRWGLDSAHRARFDLPGLTQNTWLRGLDRLLIGLAVAPHQDAGLSLTGAEAVTASDLEVIGALCELISRIRRLVSTTQAARSVTGWVELARSVIDDFIGVSYADEGLVTAVYAALARLAADHAGSATQLTCLEFTRMLANSEHRGRRLSAGNGSLQVFSPGELTHVGFRVLAMLGMGDDALATSSTGQPDAIETEGLDEQKVRQRQLLAYARAADRLIIVTQHRSERTGDRVAASTTVDWLIEQLGAEPELVEHTATASCPANFRAEAPSFDPAAFPGALAQPPAGTLTLTPRQRQRDEARRLPIGELPGQVSIAQLTAFLKDPAKAFLRSAAGISAYESVTLADDLPLTLDGLSNWQLTDELLRARIEGRDPAEVAARHRERETLPPAQLARSAFARSEATATALYGAARPFLEQAADLQRLELKIPVAGYGEVMVVDQVTTHGGDALSVTASKGADGLIRPWLESLALTASGVLSPGRLVRPEQDEHYQWTPTSRRVGLPDQEAALERLTCAVRAYALGQHRLIPVPADAAIAYVRQVAANRFVPEAWAGTPHFKHPFWSRPGSWSSFVDDATDLFTDPPLPEDPDRAQPSAFGNWAQAIYAGIEGFSAQL